MISPRALRNIVQGTLLITAICLSACKTTPPPPPPTPEVAKKPAGLFEWRGEGKSITSITVNVDEQKAHLFNGEEEIGWTYVASGITSFPTPIGSFKVLEKIADKKSNLYGKGYDAKGGLVNSDFKQGRDLLPPGGRFEAAKMTYFMRLTGDGVGMHIGPIPRPGRRASHGCIRLPSKFAGTIFKNVVVGTPVAIIGSGPDYASWLKQSAAKAPANSAKLAAHQKKAGEAAAAATAATTLAPGDPNGPAATPPVPLTTTLETTTPSSTVPEPALSLPEEVKPATPAVPSAPTGN